MLGTLLVAGSGVAFQQGGELFQPGTLLGSRYRDEATGGISLSIPAPLLVQLQEGLQARQGVVHGIARPCTGFDCTGFDSIGVGEGQPVAAQIEEAVQRPARDLEIAVGI